MSAYLFAFIIALLCVYKLRNAGRRPKDFPPGPPTLPIIGNLHLMPNNQPHHQFKKWADEYGPIYSLMLGSSVMIVLTSDQAIKDLLDKRSTIYSSRPPLHIGNMLSGGLRMLFMVSSLPQFTVIIPISVNGHNSGVWRNMANDSQDCTHAPQHQGSKILYPLSRPRKQKDACGVS